MKIFALAFALVLALAVPSLAAERGRDGIGVGGHMNRGGVGVGVHIGGAHVGVGVGGERRGERRGEHRYHRGYHGGFIGGQFGGPYYGDPCWNWVPVIGWTYVCD